MNMRVCTCVSFVLVASPQLQKKKKQGLNWFTLESREMFLPKGLKMHEKSYNHHERSSLSS